MEHHSAVVDTVQYIRCEPLPHVVLETDSTDLSGLPQSLHTNSGTYICNSPSFNERMSLSNGWPFLVREVPRSNLSLDTVGHNIFFCFRYFFVSCGQMSLSYLQSDSNCFVTETCPFRFINHWTLYFILQSRYRINKPSTFLQRCNVFTKISRSLGAPWWQYWTLLTQYLTLLTV